MVLPFAIGAITPIIPMLAHPTATTDRHGLAVASSSAQVPGMAGATGMDGADTAIAADTDTGAATAIVAATAIAIMTATAAATAIVAVDTAAAMPVVTAVDTVAAREAESSREPLTVVVDTAADMQVADTQPAAADSAAAWAVVADSTVVVAADSTAAVAAAPMVAVADTGKPLEYIQFKARLLRQAGLFIFEPALPYRAAPTGVRQPVSTGLIAVAASGTWRWCSPVPNPARHPTGSAPRP